MGHLPAAGKKAAHVVSVPDEPPSNSIAPEENLERKSMENEDSERSSKAADGYHRTNSFTALLFSIFSSSSSRDHPTENIKEHHAEGAEKISTPNENSGRKSVFARGKKAFGKAIHKAAHPSGFWHSAVPKVDSHTVNNIESSGSGTRPVTVVKDTLTQFDLPGMSEPSQLLSDNMRAALYFSLPALVKGRNWLLLYSTRRHGTSLSTLYRRSALCPGYTVLVVGDQKGAVFGGLVEAPLQPTNSRKYQGTNSSFVFTDLPGNPVIFRSTGVNHYFSLCSSDFLALGGGGGFALYLNEDLLNGTSSCSQTFGNSCLAHSEDFAVKDVELWGFVNSSQHDEMVDFCRTQKPGIGRW